MRQLIVFKTNKQHNTTAKKRNKLHQVNIVSKMTYKDRKRKELTIVKLHRIQL